MPAHPGSFAILAGDHLQNQAAIFGGARKGPILSSVQESAMAPWRLTSP